MATKLNLAGKTALITGGGGGIGAAVAAELAARGSKIVVTGRSRDSLDRATASLPRGSVLALAADVTDAAAMQHVVDAAVDRFGHLDVVFANAGISSDPASTLRTMDPSEFERVVEVDVLGVWRTIKPALEHVIDSQGHILITASIYAFVNGAVGAPYAASKAAVEQLGRALGTELRPHGATAGVLYPAWVATDLSRPAFGGDPILTEMRQRAFKGPLGSVISPERLAATVVPGIERRAARVIVPRHWVAFSVLRGILTPLIDAALVRDHKLTRLLNDLEAERLARSTRRARRSGLI